MHGWSRCNVVAVLLTSALLAAPAGANESAGAGPAFPELPLPPAIGGLIAMPQTYTKGRSALLDLIASEAEEHGVPAELVDAVIRIESGYNPASVGRVGEVGLMQVRPATAAMLGHRSSAKELFEPETNLQYGVMYLAKAWQLAEKDVCRTLMKYRAGWGATQMSALSVEYCRRARSHLAAIGSPLAGDASVPASAPTLTVALSPVPPAAQGDAAPSAAKPLSSVDPFPIATGPAALPAAKATLRQAPPQPAGNKSEPTTKSTVTRPDRWSDHDERMAAIAGKFKRSQLVIMSGL
jgi:hypothetical protein